MAQKSQGLKKYAFSSAPQLKERNLLDPSSYDFQIRKPNTDSKEASAFSSKVASSVYRKSVGLSLTPGSLTTRGQGREASLSLSDASSSQHVGGKEVLRPMGCLLASSKFGVAPILMSGRGNRKTRNGSAAKATASKGGGFNEKISSDSNPFPSSPSGEKGEKGKKGKEGEELNRRYFIVGERRISSYWWASVFFFGGLGFLITGISSYIKYNLFTSVYRAIHNPFQGLSSPGGMEAFVNNGLLGDFFKTIGVVEPFHSLSVLLFSLVSPNLSPDPSEIGQNSQLLLSQPFLIQETGGESLIFFPQGLLLCFYGSLGLLLSLYWWLLIYWNVGGGFNEFNKKEGFMRIFRWGYPGKNRRIDIVYPLKDIEAIRVELNQTPGSGLLASEQTIFIRLLSTPQVLNKEPTLFGEKNYQIEVSNSEKEKLGDKRVSSSSSSAGATRVSGADKLKVKREIPLGGIGQPLTLKEIEKQASELANYLQVALEGL